MKAHEILMFLLIFNLVVWLIGGYGLNIYNMQYQEEINPGIGGSETETEQEKQGQTFVNEIAGTTLWLLIGGITVGAVLGLVPGVKNNERYPVYVAFGTVFWVSYLKTLQVFYNIAASIEASSVDTAVFFLAVFGIFTAITVYVFIFGLMQMVTGGWRAAK